ncbi:MAG: HIT domain-containing protein [Alphaproteobacteria bacterium]|nr:HIT domain-containing protein [Alphaproteobacteria bacterium]
MAEGFALDPRLAGESVVLGDLALCRALLRDDARYWWVVLVPRRAGLVELHDLAPAELSAAVGETALASRALANLAAPTKVNVGALGNIVRQLHIHVVARREGDAAWPGPVWGAGERVPMAPDECARRAEPLRRALGLG